MGVLLVTGLQGVKRRGKQTEGAGGGQTQKTRLQHFLTQYLANISQIPSTFLFSGSFFFPWIDLCLYRGLHVESGAFC